MSRGSVVSWERLCLGPGEAREAFPSGSPTALTQHWDWAQQAMEPLSPRGPSWQQSSTLLGLHGALLSLEAFQGIQPWQLSSAWD